ncbi:MAG: AMP-binding protein [Clostridiales Family XIII bacterium]|nr:AMP-binding protein [Clostridiales Family XIII bacterium]
MDNNFKNQQQKVYPDPVIVRDMVLSSCAKHKDLPAFLVKEKNYKSPYHEISYGQLEEDIVALGAALIDAGFEGKKISVTGENCYQWAVTYMAVMFGVGTIVSLDKELSKEEHFGLIERADISAIFFTEGFDGRFDELEHIAKYRLNRYVGAENPDDVLTFRGLIEAGKALSQEKRDAYRQKTIDENALAVMKFTSGTTGLSKGVMLSSRSIGIDILAMTNVFEVGPGDRTLSVLPLHHCFESILGLLHMLSRGVCIAESDGLKSLYKNLGEAKVTVILIVPLMVDSFYRTLNRNASKTGTEEDLQKRIDHYKAVRTSMNHVTEDGRFDDSEARAYASELFAEEWKLFGGHLKAFFTGAAPIESYIIERLSDIGIKVMQGYGMTEGGPLLTGTPFFSETYKKTNSVGPALECGILAIDNPDKAGIGEIIWKSDSNMLGYYQMPEKTAEVLRDGWYYSGDYGYLDEDGWLIITGRKNNLIVSRTGKNIFPEELEFGLSRSAYIDELMVYGVDDEGRGGPIVSVQIRPAYEAIHEKLGADVTPEQVLELLTSEVEAFNETQPHYKKIRNVLIRDKEFIKTASKKIKRAENIKF